MLLDCDCSQQFAYKGAVNLAGRDCPFSFRTVVRYLLVYIQIIRLRYSWRLNRSWGGACTWPWCPSCSSAYASCFPAVIFYYVTETGESAATIAKYQILTTRIGSFSHCMYILSVYVPLLFNNWDESWLLVLFGEDRCLGSYKKL